MNLEAKVILSVMISR